MTLKFTLRLFLVLVILASSCKNKKEKEAENIVSEWVGKEIFFPQNLKCSIMGKDTTLNFSHKKPYKIFMYVDSTGCTRCNLGLTEWDLIIQEANASMREKLDFLIIIHPKDEKDINLLLKHDQFSHPVFIDRTNMIDKKNHFSTLHPYQCFLLDECNRVLMVGNPSSNPRIWELYKSRITKKAKAKKDAYTSVKFNTPLLDFGEILTKHMHKSLVSIKN
ncbi:MAG: hypothetical protein PHS30_01785 [Bacteroidales bacterium]|nr:hypothetical protein [Bacteroidales bacterium]